MSSESILILYKIKEAYQIDQDNIFNATYLSVIKEKEIYLIDILNHFMNIKSIGIYYSFSCQASDELIHLQSPLSVLPVYDNQIILILTPSNQPPVVPLNQIGLYQKLSRKLLYSTYYDEYESNDNRNNNDNENNSSSQQQQQQQQGYSQQQRQPQPPLSEGGAYPPSKPSRKSNAPSRSTKNNNNVDYGNNTNNNQSSSHSPRSQQQQQQQQQQQSNFQTGAGATDDTVNAIADFSKQTAEKMKKTFFQFAQTSIQKVTEVVENVASTVNNNNTINGGGNTPSASIFSSSPIKVGRYQVSIIKEIAEGGFGIVYLVQDSNSNNNDYNTHSPTAYAMKKMLIQSKEQQSDAQSELQSLKLFTGANRHPNIVELLDSTVTASTTGNTREMLLLFPFYTHGSVWDAISNALPQEQHSAIPWPYNEQQAVFIIIGVAYALSAIHDRGYAHRDVKPHNILIDNDGTPVLTDLGSMATAIVEVRTRKEALMLQDDASTRISAPYRPPELTEVPTHAFPLQFDSRIDIWALGCTMFCMAYGRSPFETAREGVQKLAILNGRYTTPPGQRMRSCVFSDAYMNIIKKMLIVDHLLRPTISEVIGMLNELSSSR